MTVNVWKWLSMRFGGLILLLYCHFSCTSSEKIRSVLLPYECNPRLDQGECKWSNWTRTCFWPQGDVDAILRNFTAELGSHGCQIPLTDFSRGVLKRRIEMVFSNAVLKRVSVLTKPCGACGFRLRCCNKAPNFLHQSLDAFQCTRGSFVKACIVPALTPDELEANHVKHFDWPHTSNDMCDFNQFVPLHKIPAKDPTSLLMQRLMCTFYGTAQPIITCTKLSNLRCQCCCNGFVPSSDGYCIPDPDQRRDPLCYRNEDEADTCPGKEKRVQLLAALNDIIKNH